MSMVITNPSQLASIFMPKLQEAVEYTVQKIWSENRELIQTLIYEPYQPLIYERTMQFKEAWDIDVKSSTDHIEGEFKYNPSAMEPDPLLGQHASIVTGEPSMEDLAHIIYDGVAGHIFGTGYWTQKRDAWSALDKWLTNKQFRKIFEESMTRAGIPWKTNKGKLRVEKSK